MANMASSALSQSGFTTSTIDEPNETSIVTIATIFVR